MIKDAVASLEKAVKSVVELGGIARTRGYPEEEVLEEVKKSLRDIIDPEERFGEGRNERNTISWSRQISFPRLHCIIL